MPKAPTPSYMRGNYPFDLDAGLRYVRPKTGFDFFPYPYLVQNISGFLPMFDVETWAQAFGKKGFGPGWNSVPLNLQAQIVVPGLNKFGVK